MKKIIVFVFLLIIGFFISQRSYNRSYNDTIETREQDAHMGNSILNAVYSYEEEYNEFPDSLNQLVPRFLDTIPDTDWITGWEYSKWDLEGSSPYVFKLSKFTAGYKTKVIYTHESDRAYWIVNSEGTRFRMATLPPEEVEELFPNGNLGVPKELIQN